MPQQGPLSFLDPERRPTHNRPRQYQIPRAGEDYRAAWHEHFYGPLESFPSAIPHPILGSIELVATNAGDGKILNYTWAETDQLYREAGYLPADVGTAVFYTGVLANPPKDLGDSYSLPEIEIPIQTANNHFARRNYLVRYLNVVRIVLSSFIVGSHHATLAEDLGQLLLAGHREHGWPLITVIVGGLSWDGKFLAWGDRVVEFDLFNVAHTHYDTSAYPTEDLYGGKVLDLFVIHGTTLPSTYVPANWGSLFPGESGYEEDYDQFERLFNRIDDYRAIFLTYPLVNDIYAIGDTILYSNDNTKTAHQEAIDGDGAFADRPLSRFNFSQRSFGTWQEVVGVTRTGVTGKGIRDLSTTTQDYLDIIKEHWELSEES